ncbi:hypothetical protein CAOG_009615 [Capsaspora owczarzaki ATCC 30864]|uniref:Uncharacterized protein n=1 Tax=Capsaspora owczarzaki (strain ATCC 30864) TaxID=595528 RepID=A0A0D2X250_CAPO3|nr:hypothetical protein CAOG_009615 [Capsaspora owczarzaki ATCC 30864]
MCAHCGPGGDAVRHHPFRRERRVVLYRARNRQNVASKGQPQERGVHGVQGFVARPPSKRANVKGRRFSTRFYGSWCHRRGKVIQKEGQVARDNPVSRPSLESTAQVNAEECAVEIVHGIQHVIDNGERCGIRDGKGAEDKMTQTGRWKECLRQRNDRHSGEIEDLQLCLVLQVIEEMRQHYNIAAAEELHLSFVRQPRARRAVQNKTLSRVQLPQSYGIVASAPVSTRVRCDCCKAIFRVRSRIGRLHQMAVARLERNIAADHENGIERRNKHVV